MFTIYKYLFLATSLAFIFTSCKKDDETEIITEFKDTSLDVPSTYEFDSRFDNGVSSVARSGQVVRNLLIQDIKAIISNAAASSSPSAIKNDVLELYNYADNGKTTLTQAGSFDLLVSVYDNIATGKSLSGKMDPDVVIGFGSNQTADDLINTWLDQIDANILDGKTGADIYITTDSVDLSQMINKVLTGAVAYSQGVGKYLTNATTEDNVSRKDGDATYTTAEHVWDEAFGYFGAATDYNSFSNDELASKNGGSVYKDGNSDGKIDFTSEYNFGISTNAGKRERITSMTNVETYLRKDAFDAFLTGRTALSNKRGADEIRIYARQVAQAWEKIIAATAIHYINEVNKDLQDRIDNTVSSKYDLYKHWSEMKAFLMMLQYGSADYQLISISDLTAIHDVIGETPNVADKAAYQQSLLEIADDLRLIYNFDKDNVSNWRLK